MCAPATGVKGAAYWGDQSLGQERPERQPVNRWEGPSMPCRGLALLCGGQMGSRMGFKRQGMRECHPGDCEEPSGGGNLAWS